MKQREMQVKDLKRRLSMKDSIASTFNVSLKYNITTSSLTTKVLNIKSENIDIRYSYPILCNNTYNDITFSNMEIGNLHVGIDDDNILRAYIQMNELDHKDKVGVMEFQNDMLIKVLEIVDGLAVVYKPTRTRVMIKDRVGINTPFINRYYGKYTNKTSINFLGETIDDIIEYDKHN